MSKDIFRKAALERLSSPEQLDRLVTITSPKTWVALLMVGAILVAAIVWSIQGTLPTFVQGNGILISSGGRVANVQATANGIVTEMTVRIGDAVEIGQIVANISQTDVEQQLRNAEAVLQERLENQTRLAMQALEEVTLRNDNIALRRQALNERLNTGEEQVRLLRRQLADEESLIARKIITRDMVMRTRVAFNQAAQEVADVRNALAQLEVERVELESTLINRKRSAEEAVNEARRRIAEIETTLSQATVVMSPASGIVTEVKASPGAMVAQGQSLLTLQSGGQFLDLMLYIPPQHGKRVQPGMAVQISPATAKREEFGTIKGEIEWISDFPASPDGMRTVLQNDDLVRTFTQSGPPYAARVTLLRDPESVSGYRWTSAKGASLPLSGGTLATAEITVAQRAPITLVIPLLRELTGIY